jgi:hypothetical protein
MLRRHRATLACASASAPATAGVRFRTNRRTLALRADPSRPGSIFAAGATFTLVRRSQRQLAAIEPPLLRFGPLQHIPAAMRCPGLGLISLPASGRSRFGVLIRQPAPRLRTDWTDHSPLRFFAIGGAKRRRSIWRTLWTGSRSSYSPFRPTLLRLAPLRRLHEHLQFQSSIDPSRGRGPGEPEVALMRIRPFERLRFNSPPEPGHAPSRTFGAVFRYPHGSFEAPGVYA